MHQCQVLGFAIDEPLDQTDTARRHAQQTDGRPEADNDAQPRAAFETIPGPGEPAGDQDGQRRQIGQAEAKVLPWRAGVERVHDGRPAYDEHEGWPRPGAHGCPHADQDPGRQQWSEESHVRRREGVVQTVRLCIRQVSVGGKEVAPERVQRRPRVDLQIAGKRRRIGWVIEQPEQRRRQDGYQDRRRDQRRGRPVKQRTPAHDSARVGLAVSRRGVLDQGPEGIGGERHGDQPVDPAAERGVGDTGRRQHQPSQTASAGVARQGPGAQGCQRQARRVGHNDDARLPQLAAQCHQCTGQHRCWDFVWPELAHEQRREHRHQPAHDQADRLAG